MPWNVLDIAPTRDEREIRRAYARLLKTRQHEGNPSYFETVRRAYEQAMWLCRQEPEQESALKLEPSIDGEAAGEAHEEAAGEAPQPSTQSPEQQPAPSPEQLAERAAQDALFESLNVSIRVLDEHFAAIAPHDAEAALPSWQAVRDHILLQRLDVREQVSEVMADMIARRWPASVAVWPLAAKQFGWEPPTSHDRGRLAAALRWLYEEHDGEEARLEHLHDIYRAEAPHPNTILARKESPWRRHVRFARSRAERVVMRRFAADIEAMNLRRHFAHQADALAWWRHALATPRLTKRHVLPLLCCLLPAVMEPSQWEAWVPLLLGSIFVALWHGSSLAWHYWRRDRGPLLNRNSAVVMLGSPLLLAIGILANGFAAILESPALMVGGVVAAMVSAIWVWALLAPNSHIRFMNDEQLLRFGFFFLLVSLGFAMGLRPIADETTDALLALRIAYGFAMALWLLIGAAPALGAYESRWPSIVRLRAEYGIAIASLALLALHLFASHTRATQSLLCAFDTLLVLLCWAFAIGRDWEIKINGFWIYLVSLFGLRLFSSHAGAVKEAEVPVMAALLGVVLFAAAVQIVRRRSK